MGKVRLLIGLAVAIFSFISYAASKEYNPVTGEDQHIGIAKHQEIALGQQSAPQMIQEFGGLDPDPQLQAVVDRVGQRVVRRSRASGTEWEFDFHLLADPQTVNAFALPGGQIFITGALFDRLETEGQLAAVLGHEIGHVVARHSTQRIAKENLRNGITLAVILGTDMDPRTADIAGQLISMKYGREDELESDVLGVDFMSDAGYDPRAMIGVMEILASASDGQRPPEFMSTHPNPENRVGRIQTAIAQKFPNGVPGGLSP
ncbi:MAG: M48 family metallopeptidase [Candidatus Eisenbacteria bacterium]